MGASARGFGKAGTMPSVDVVDEMQSVRDDLIKKVEKHAGKRGASYLYEAINAGFGQLIEFVEDERREWERVIDFLMDKEFDD